jgi:hypothetical protein
MTLGSRLSRYIAVMAVMGLLAVGLPGSSASAHETREVEGEFEFVVGFMNEPAYVNEKNGLDLRISYLNGNGQTENDDEDADDHDHNGNDDQYATEAEPVEGAHQTLQAQVQFAGETKDLELRELWGQPGSYTADVIPTETGAYSFQISGEIDGIEVNETFTAGPDTFSEIEPRDELEFPENGGDSVADDSDQAAAFGIAGVVAGLLGLAVGGAAYYKVNSQNGDNKNPAQRRREAKLAEQRKQQQQSDDED